jgi:hypothetical protein
LWHEGTQRPIHRPTDPEDQQAFSSGQQNCPTIKNRLLIEATGHLGFWRATDDGQAHANLRAALEGSSFPPGSGLDQAMGFQAYTGDGLTIFPPKTTPPGGALTPPEKARNRAISSISIRSEHAIGGVKRDRMGKDKIRLLKEGIRDTVMETCCGLHNFRLQYRPWNYANS